MADKLPPTADKRCGTTAGYPAHRYRGERACERCLRARAHAMRAWRADNPKKVKQQKRAYYEANREKTAETSRRYYTENRTAILEQKRAYYEANREALISKARKWHDANRESANAGRRARYHAARAAGVDPGAEYREANREEAAVRSREWRSRIADALAPVAVHGGRPYTAEDDAIIRATYAHPRIVVAVQLRRTPDSINYRRQVLRKADRASLVGAS